MNQLSDIKTLCAYLQEMEHKHETMEAELQELTARIEYFKTDVIPTYLMSLGITKFELDDGQTVGIGTKVFASISEERAPAAFKWLREHGLGSIIKTEYKMIFGEGMEDAVDKQLLKNFLTEKEINADTKEAVHSQTLKATMRQLIESGTQVPSEVFALHIVKEVQIGK